MDWVPISSSLPPQTSYIEALTTDVMVFGGRVYQRWLNFDEVMRVGSHGGIRTLMRRDQDRAPVFSFCLPREGTAEKSAVWKPGGGLSDCGTSPPLELWQTEFYWESHPVWYFVIAARTDSDTGSCWVFLHPSQRTQWLPRSRSELWTTTTFWLFAWNSLRPSDFFRLKFENLSHSHRLWTSIL